MSERAKQLRGLVDRQIADLLELISTLDEEKARRPCPGREKLGDGTVAACARFTVDNYLRIAGFMNDAIRGGGYRSHGDGGPRSAELPRVGGHGPGSHARLHDGDEHADPYRATNADLGAAARALVLARETLTRIAELSDSQLEAIPPNGSLPFCDGRRTLERVLASLLKHRAHHLDALNAAIA